MNGCQGLPQTEQGIRRACPLRRNCHPHLSFLKGHASKAKTMLGPYDLDEETCSQYDPEDYDKEIN
jgi:hypothetical protein